MASKNSDFYSYLLPSELARLVLGYLESQGCKQTVEKFLEELPELSEIFQLRKQGRKVQSKVWQLSLQEALLDYAYSKELIRSAAVEHPHILAHLLESCLLSEQLRCLVSAITTSRTMVKVCAQQRKRKQSAFGEKLLCKKAKLSEASPCPSNTPSAKTPVDVVDGYDDQVLQPDVPSTPQKTPTKERLSPKRKDFRVRRRPPPDEITTVQEYHEQLTASILSNTAFHEHFAAAINKTLAEQGYAVVGEDATGKSSETSSSKHITDTNSSAADCQKTTPSEMASASTVVDPSVDGASGKVEAAGNASSSAFTSNVVETVSKLIMDDPNYHELFFFGIPSDNSNSRDAAAAQPSSSLPPCGAQSRSTQPCGAYNSSGEGEVAAPRLLSTPEPHCSYTDGAEVTRSGQELGNVFHTPPRPRSAGYQGPEPHSGQISDTENLQSNFDGDRGSSATSSHNTSLSRRSPLDQEHMEPICEQDHIEPTGNQNHTGPTSAKNHTELTSDQNPMEPTTCGQNQAVAPTTRNSPARPGGSASCSSTAQVMGEQVGCTEATDDSRHNYMQANITQSSTPHLNYVPDDTPQYRGSFSNYAPACDMQNVNPSSDSIYVNHSLANYSRSSSMQDYDPQLNSMQASNMQTGVQNNHFQSATAHECDMYPENVRSGNVQNLNIRNNEVRAASSAMSALNNMSTSLGTTHSTSGQPLNTYATVPQPTVGQATEVPRATKPYASSVPLGDATYIHAGGSTPTPVGVPASNPVSDSTSEPTFHVGDSATTPVGDPASFPLSDPTSLPSYHVGDSATTRNGAPATLNDISAAHPRAVAADSPTCVPQKGFSIISDSIPLLDNTGKYAKQPVDKSVSPPGMLAVLEFPPPDGCGSAQVKVIVPKSMDCSEIRQPMTVTLPNLVSIKYGTKFVRSLPAAQQEIIRQKNRAAKKSKRKNTVSKVGNVTKARADDTESGVKPPSTGEKIITAALDAAFAAVTPDKEQQEIHGGARTTDSLPSELPSTENEDLSDLQVENENLPGLQGENEDLPDLQGENEDLPDLQGENEDLPDLQGENEDLPDLQGENEDLPDLQGENENTAKNISDSNPDVEVDKSPVPVLRSSKRLMAKTDQGETSSADDKKESDNSLQSRQLRSRVVRNSASVGNAEQHLSSHGVTMSAVKSVTVHSEVASSSERGSQSTPSYKRRRSHVRALEFRTPIKSPGKAQAGRLQRCLFSSPPLDKTDHRLPDVPNIRSPKGKATQPNQNLSVIMEEASIVLSDSSGCSPSPRGRRKRRRLCDQEMNEEKSAPEEAQSMPILDFSEYSEALLASVSCKKSRPKENNMCSNDESSHHESDKANLSDSECVLPSLLSDALNTPYKMSEVSLEPPTPVHQGIPSTAKKMSGLGTDLNTPRPTSFPPFSPCSKTPTGKLDRHTFSAVPTDDDHLPETVPANRCVASQSDAAPGKSLREVGNSNAGGNENDARQNRQSLSPMTMGLMLENELLKSVKKNNPGNDVTDENPCASATDATENADVVEFSAEEPGTQATLVNDEGSCAVVNANISSVTVSLPSLGKESSLSDLVTSIENEQFSITETKSKKKMKSTVRKKSSKKKNKRSKSKNSQSGKVHIQQQEESKNPKQNEFMPEQEKGDCSRRSERDQIEEGLLAPEGVDETSTRGGAVTIVGDGQQEKETEVNRVTMAEKSTSHISVSQKTSHKEIVKSAQSSQISIFDISDSSNSPEFLGNKTTSATNKLTSVSNSGNSEHEEVDNTELPRSVISLARISPLKPHSVTAKAEVTSESHLKQQSESRPSDEVQVFVEEAISLNDIRETSISFSKSTSDSTHVPKKRNSKECTHKRKTGTKGKVKLTSKYASRERKEITEEKKKKPSHKKPSRKLRIESGSEEDSPVKELNSEAHLKEKPLARCVVTNEFQSSAKSVEKPGASKCTTENSLGKCVVGAGKLSPVKFGSCSEEFPNTPKGSSRKSLKCTPSASARLGSTPSASGRHGSTPSASGRHGSTPLALTRSRLLSTPSSSAKKSQFPQSPLDNIADVPPSPADVWEKWTTVLSHGDADMSFADNHSDAEEHQGDRSNNDQLSQLGCSKNSPRDIAEARRASANATGDDGTSGSMGPTSLQIIAQETKSCNRDIMKSLSRKRYEQPSSRGRDAEKEDVSHESYNSAHKDRRGLSSSPTSRSECSLSQISNPETLSCKRRLSTSAVGLPDDMTLASLGPNNANAAGPQTEGPDRVQSLEVQRLQRALQGFASPVIYDTELPSSNASRVRAPAYSSSGALAEQVDGGDLNDSYADLDSKLAMLDGGLDSDPNSPASATLAATVGSVVPASVGYLSTSACETSNKSGLADAALTAGDDIVPKTSKDSGPLPKKDADFHCKTQDSEKREDPDSESATSDSQGGVSAANEASPQKEANSSKESQPTQDARLTPSKCSVGKQLASFTPLPPTPEKEMRSICSSMVREGPRAMVAVPTSQRDFEASVNPGTGSSFLGPQNDSGKSSRVDLISKDLSPMEADPNALESNFEDSSDEEVEINVCLSSSDFISLFELNLESGHSTSSTTSRASSPHLGSHGNAHVTESDHFSSKSNSFPTSCSSVATESIAITANSAPQMPSQSLTTSSKSTASTAVPVNFSVSDSRVTSRDSTDSAASSAPIDPRIAKQKKPSTSDPTPNNSSMPDDEHSISLPVPDFACLDDKASSTCRADNIDSNRNRPSSFSNTSSKSSSSEAGNVPVSLTPYSPEVYPVFKIVQAGEKSDVSEAPHGLQDRSASIPFTASEPILDKPDSRTNLSLRSKSKSLSKVDVNPAVDFWRKRDVGGSEYSTDCSSPDQLRIVDTPDWPPPTASRDSTHRAIKSRTSNIGTCPVRDVNRPEGHGNTNESLFPAWSRACRTQKNREAENASGDDSSRRGMTSNVGKTELDSNFQKTHRISASPKHSSDSRSDLPSARDDARSRSAANDKALPFSNQSRPLSSTHNRARYPAASKKFALNLQCVTKHLDFGSGVVPKADCDTQGKKEKIIEQKRPNRPTNAGHKKSSSASDIQDTTNKYSNSTTVAENFKMSSVSSKLDDDAVLRRPSDVLKSKKALSASDITANKSLSTSNIPETIGHLFNEARNSEAEEKFSDTSIDSRRKHRFSNILNVPKTTDAPTVVLSSDAATLASTISSDPATPESLDSETKKKKKSKRSRSSSSNKSQERHPSSVTDETTSNFSRNSDVRRSPAGRRGTVSNTSRDDSYFPQAPPTPGKYIFYSPSKPCKSVKDSSHHGTRVNPYTSTPLLGTQLPKSSSHSVPSLSVDSYTESCSYLERPPKTPGAGVYPDDVEDRTLLGAEDKTLMDSEISENMPRSETKSVSGSQEIGGQERGREELDELSGGCRTHSASASKRSDSETCHVAGDQSLSDAHSRTRKERPCDLQVRVGEHQAESRHSGRCEVNSTAAAESESAAEKENFACDQSADCSALSAILPPSDAVSSPTPAPVVSKKNILLPKKTEAEMIKFIEMFRRKTKKK